MKINNREYSNFEPLNKLLDVMNYLGFHDQILSVINFIENSSYDRGAKSGSKSAKIQLTKSVRLLHDSGYSSDSIVRMIVESGCNRVIDESKLVSSRIQERRSIFKEYTNPKIIELKRGVI